MRSCFAATAGWISLTVLGLCALSPMANAQDLTIKSTHTGTFQLGQTNAYYLLRVSNVGSAPTSGAVTVTENPPAGLTVTSMHGQGWTCTVTSCHRSDSLAAGASYPAIMVVATVGLGAGSSLTNQVTVSGGADVSPANNANYDPTIVVTNGYPLAWGDNRFGESNVPPGLSGVVAIAAGKAHSLALKNDGTVVAWGYDESGASTVPAGLSGIVAIAAGEASLALKGDGTVEAWGFNGDGQANVPTGLSDVVGIAAGGFDGLALKGDGTVVAWGSAQPAYYHGQAAAVPAGLSDVVAIAAGTNYGQDTAYSLALKSDGTVVAWGDNAYGESTVPAGLSGVVAIAAGNNLSLALKSDGTVADWGITSGENTLPAGLSGVVAIAVGEISNLALKSDGTVVTWGGKMDSALAEPASLSSVVAIAAGGFGSSLVLRSATPSTIPVTFAFSGPNAAPLNWVVVDGTPYLSGAFVLDWTPGTSHTVSATSLIEDLPWTQWVFTGWSDGGATTHAVAPTALATFTAGYKTQYLVTTAVNPPAGGSISPATGWFDGGSSLLISATPSTGYVFAGFSGALTSTTNPQSLSVPTDAGAAMMTVTANFAPSGTGGPCTYAISPTDQSFPTTGGPGTVTVTTQAGCAWSATNALSWVTLTAPSSGTGSGRLSLQVPANTGATRSGTFTVAGQTFTVEQVGSTSFTSTSLFPHFASGAGWNTRLILINTGLPPITVRLNFLTDTGTLVALPLNLPQTTGTAPLLASTLERTLASGATLVIDTASTSSTEQDGWVQVLSTGTVAGYDNYRLSTDNGFREVFLPLQGTGANTLLIPFDHTDGYVTGIAIANTSTVNGTVGVTIRDDSGNLILTTTAAVPTQGHKSFILATDYPATAGIRGTIEFDGAGAGGIGALGVRAGANHEIAAVVPVVK